MVLPYPKRIYQQNQMTTVKFWGASDDLVEVEGCSYAIDYTNEDEQVSGPNNTAEFSVYNNALFLVDAGHAGQIFVTATYNNLGFWVFTAHHMQNACPYPSDWATALMQSPNSIHSMQLVIEIPSDTVQIHRVK